MALSFSGRFRVTTATRSSTSYRTVSAIAVVARTDHAGAVQAGDGGVVVPGRGEDLVGVLAELWRPGVDRARRGRQHGREAGQRWWRGGGGVGHVMEHADLAHVGKIEQLLG